MQAVADVELREITKDTVRDICDLRVAPGQAEFVAPNAESIAQAYFEPRAWFRAVYAGEEPVGFVMLYLDPDGTGPREFLEPGPVYYIWRFMIAAAHQGKGYGARALELVIQHIRGLPGARAVYLSVFPAEGSAEAFYQRYGFERTGRTHGPEVEMRLALTEGRTADS